MFKLGVAGQEEEGRVAVSVCYRVGLRGLAKRLCLAWIPRAVEIPLQSQPPTSPKPPSAGLPSTADKVGSLQSNGPLPPHCGTFDFNLHPPELE